MYKKLKEVNATLIAERNLVSLLIEEKAAFKRLKEMERMRDRLIKEDILTGGKKGLLKLWKESM